MTGTDLATLRRLAEDGNEEAADRLADEGNDTAATLLSRTISESG